MAHSRNDSSKKSFLNGKSGAILLFLGLAFGLYLSSRYNYVLFHSLSEIFSVAIAFGIFAVAWNSRRFLENHYLLLIGIASLFIGGIDFVHTLAYKGMGVFSGYEPTNLGAQLWIAARYMGALSFLAAMLLIHRKIRIGATFIIYSVITTLVLASIFYWQNFPLTFVVGSGLTPFKVISEYIISFILLCSIALLVRYRRELGTMADLMIVAMAVNIASEMAFTLYVDAYGIANMVGHFLKVLSFYFIYLAIIQTSLTKPYDHLFRSLKQREANLGEANARLEKEIAERKQAEEALARAAREWQATFDSISDLVSIQDTNFRLVKVNRAFARALGSTPEELSGKICYEVMHHTDEPVTSCPHCETLETGKPATREFFEPHLGAYLEVSTSPLRDDKGNVIGSAHIALDITERKQAE
ncbi:MAG: MASE3 domain-containing protein, partial [Dehalococcoidales bacterium]|nr:MASE3 domain-containing protein [Dehalococcoidales bacterium]